MDANNNYRMAALQIHGLHPKDRQWMFEKFSSSQRATLQNLVNELDELGLVSAESILPAEMAFPVSSRRLEMASVDELNQVEPEIIFNMMVDLPDRLKAMILFSHRWHWTSAIFSRFSEDQRTRLRRQMNKLESIKPAAFVALIDAFLESTRLPAKPSSKTNAAAKRLDTSEYRRI